MKKKQILTLVLCVLATQVFAQTKLIAFKSHSGSRANFKEAHEKNLFTMGKSNFGQINFQERERLDSVIFISDTATVLVSHYEWSARISRDTLYNHPLFSAKNSPEKIKNIVRQQNYYLNPMETVAFILPRKEESLSLANIQRGESEINVNEDIAENVSPLLPPYEQANLGIINVLAPIIEEPEPVVTRDSLNQPENPVRVIPEPVVFEVDSGLNTSRLFEMVLFPNPSRDKTTVMFTNPDNETFSIQVYDARGRIVLAADKLTGRKYEIDISKFERGVYIVELSMNEIRGIKRLVVR